MLASLIFTSHPFAIDPMVANIAWIALGIGTFLCTGYLRSAEKIPRTLAVVVNLYIGMGAYLAYLDVYKRHYGHFPAQPLMEFLGVVSIAVILYVVGKRLQKKIEDRQSAS